MATTTRPCRSCKGDGYHVFSHRSGDPQLETEESCHACNGEGQVPDDSAHDTEEQHPAKCRCIDCGDGDRAYDAWRDRELEREARAC